MTKLLSGWAAYRDRRMLTILAMGFSSGLPLALTGSTLSYWLKTVGVSKTSIGLFGLVGASYSLKFLWAPFFDHVAAPLIGKSLGRRRAWMLVTQAGLILSLLSIGHTNPAVNPTLTALAAVAVAFFSACQDIVIDAYRIEILDEAQQGAGAAATQFGYRLGMIAAGAGGLYLSEALPWSGVYLVMAALVGVGVATAWASPEPALVRHEGGPGTIAHRLKLALIDPLLDFTTKPLWPLILLFVVLFKLNNAIAASMATPFYVELGFTADQLATTSKIFGLFATAFGIALGGWLVAAHGLARALVIGGILQIVSTWVYALQASLDHTVLMLAVSIFAENVTDGIGSAAFIAYLSGLCSREFTATQYALLSSLAVLGRSVISSGSGWFADHTDWVTFFLGTSALGLPGMILLAFLLHRGLGTEARGTAKQAA